MTTTETILKGMVHNITIMQHLYSKFDPKDENWRPRENMRSTLELLQYVTYIGQATVSQYLNPGADVPESMKRYNEYKMAAEKLTFAEIPQALEDEKNAIVSMMGAITDADLQRQTSYPWGGDLELEHALLNNSLQFLNAYRHQIFIYAKMLGAEIGTRNNWAGQDVPAKAAAAETA